MDDLTDDFNLLINNTQTYNIEGSLIFEDSVVLQTIFNEARDSIVRDGTLPPEGPAMSNPAALISDMNNDD